MRWRTGNCYPPKLEFLKKVGGFRHGKPWEMGEEKPVKVVGKSCQKNAYLWERMKTIKDMAIITSLSQLDFSKRYTYADYLKWQFKERVELLKGWVFANGSSEP